MFIYLFLHLIGFFNLNKKLKNPDRCVKYISLFHSIISSIGGVLYLLNYISKETHYISVMFSLGYVIYDLLIYSIFKELKYERNITYFHHSLFLFGIFLYPSNPYIYSRLIISELSTIPLNLRWIAKFNNQQKKKYIYSILFYVSFFLFRIINCTHLFFLIEKDIILYLMVIFLILNYYWFYLMNLKLIKIYFTKKQ
jgi:hypothetical protein